MGKDVTNEHFVPEPGLGIEDYLARGNRTAVHHLIRYAWACEVLDDLGPSRILDVACGSGYGTHQIAISQDGSEVVGGDYDPAALELARSRYEAPNLSFLEADVTRWGDSLGDAPFDCIVCFDTIEHVEHREIAMQSVVEHLVPGGALLLSTPVKSQPVLNPAWEHHKIEFSRWALYDFLCRYFDEVLAPDLGTLPHAEVFDRVNLGADPPVYLLKMNPVLCRGPVRIVRPPLKGG